MGEVVDLEARVVAPPTQVALVAPELLDKDLQEPRVVA
jgi:hypothetical protein